MFRTLTLSLGVAAAFALTAHAEPNHPTKLSDLPAGTVIGERRVMVVTPPEQFNSSPPFEVSNVLYVNRCVGGCMVMGGDINDARQHISTYITPGPHTVTEYKDINGTLTNADAEWTQIVQCLKEIYSPFNIVVTETKPASGNYTEAIIAGDSPDVGLSRMILGVAPAHTSCAPNDNAMSYTFANNPYFGGSVQTRVWELCSTAGQESAHHFGLDHAYEFFDKTSACNDPMTYRTDCGGQKFFRNKAAQCGEGEIRDCFCGGLQNSHAKILGVFGPGTTLIAPPTIANITPASGTAIDGQVVTWSAGSKRGVEKSELYLNGWKWAEVKGATFGSNGQLNPSPYNTKFPPGVPNGVIDIQVKAYDDLGAMTESSIATVTKGQPCANATTDCAMGQKCEAGKCFWDAPTGKLGDSCDYQQFCESNSCVITEEGGYCSQECIVGAMEACPEGYDCVQAGTAGACLPSSGGGGCCSVGGPDALWFHGGLSLLVLGLVVGRRRRRRNRL